MIRFLEYCLSKLFLYTGEIYLKSFGDIYLLGLLIVAYFSGKKYQNGVLVDLNGEGEVKKDWLSKILDTRIKLGAVFLYLLICVSSDLFGSELLLSVPIDDNRGQIITNGEEQGFFFETVFQTHEQIEGLAIRVEQERYFETCKVGVKRVNCEQAEKSKKYLCKAMVGIKTYVVADSGGCTVEMVPMLGQTGGKLSVIVDYIYRLE